MKKVLLFVIAVSVTLFRIRAQVPNIYIDPSSHNLHFAPTDLGDAASYVTNPASFSRDLRWIRIIDNEPATWSTTVCDMNNCYASTVSSMDFSLASGNNGLLRLTINTGGTEGTANYQLYVYDINDSANVNATMTIAAVADNGTGISDPGIITVSIFPNPAKDFVNVSSDGNFRIDKIEIYNVVGQKFKTVSLASDIQSVSIPVTDLKKGVYFIRIFSGKEVITKTFSKE